MNWLERTLEGVRHTGFAVVMNVLDSASLDKTRTAMYHVQEKVLNDVGEERLKGRIGSAPLDAEL
jgi:hypothetical protein